MDKQTWTELKARIGVRPVPTIQPKPERKTVMENQLVALDPHQMAGAQTALIEWCDGKLAALDGELASAHGIIDALREGGMSDARGRRLITGINKRAAFYGKIKAALENGYYILPPIPHQTFAIRSARELPQEKRSTTGAWGTEPKPQILQVGDGEYHNATAERQVVSTVQEKNNKGELVTKNVFGNVAWKDVEFPFFPVKPEIIEATGKAMARKIFDWLGVAPQYRAADPMVIGCIKHYKQYQQPVHFFVAWWLDVNTL